MQGRLCRGLAHGEPRSLNVGDIVQHQPAHGDDAQVFERRKAGFHALPFQLGARRTENPRDEGDEAVIAFGTAGLQVADAQQVVDALVRRLDVPVHHRRRGRQIQAVGFVHHVEPLLDRRFGGGDGPAHV